MVRDVAGRKTQLVKKCTNTWRAGFMRPRYGQFPVNRELETASNPRQQVHDFGPLSFPRSLPLNFFHRRCDELHTHTHARKTLVPCLYCIFIFTRRMRDRGGWKWNAEAEETKQAPKRFRGKREDCRPPSSYQQFLFPRHQNFRPLLSLLPTLHVLISYRTQCSERERI